MKKITNLLIVCSLALAGAVMAQQPMAEESPGKKSEKQAPAEAKPKAPQAPKADVPAAPKPETPAVKDPAASKHAPKSEAPAAKEPAATNPEMKDKKNPPAAAPNAHAEQPATRMTPPATDPHSAHSSKHPKAPAADAMSSTTPAPPKTAATASPAAAKTTPAAAASTAPTTPAAPAASTAPAATAAPSVAQTSPTKPVNPAAAAKKPDPQKVEQIKTQHASFRAQPKPDRVPPVTFSAGFRIEGSDRWQGPQYEVYRSYRPERHDQSWYRSRYQRVELIAGGYYYFNSGYWYPAWGYNPANEYYAYDAPIYVGKSALPPDKVIANVQAVLQEMGYYKGEVDGLLGPLTREALTGYQADNGMTVTAVIDEPTLDSLGMG
jgi:hypothetical protein